MHWFRPSASPKFHIFKDGRSLCLKWAFSPKLGKDEEVNPSGPIVACDRDCKACVRRYNATLPRPEKKPSIFD